MRIGEPVSHADTCDVTSADMTYGPCPVCGGKPVWSADDFEPDILGNDPDLTTFDTMEDAIQDINAALISDGQIENGAIYDNWERKVVWTQPK